MEVSEPLGQVLGRGDIGDPSVLPPWDAQPGAFLGCTHPGQSPASAANLDGGFVPSPSRTLLSLAQVMLIFSHTGSCLWVMAFRGGGAGFPPSSLAPAAVPVLWKVPGHTALPLPQFPPPPSLWVPAGAPTSGATHGTRLWGRALSWHPHPGTAPTPHPRVSLGPGARSCPWGRLPGSAARVMLPLGTGIYPLAQLVPINRWWDL